MATIRKDKIKRLIESGNILIKCNHKFTDDYSFDNATNFGKSEWKLAKIGDISSPENGFIILDSEDFSRFSSSRCYDQGLGYFHFYIHSNLSYTLKIKE